MANRFHQTTWKDIVFFWAKVLVISVILGVISFFIGRNYLGDMIAETSIKQDTPEIVAQVSEDRPPAPGDEAAPPDEAKVEVYERDPSDAEVDRAREEYTIVEGTSEDSDTDAAGGEDQTEETEQEVEAEPASDESVDQGAAETEDTASDSDEDGREFVVIAGSFVNIENAEKVVGELRGEGYEPYITQVIIGGRTYNRVNVAAYPSRQRAGELAQQLRGSGYDVTVGVR